jgi:hypothetical protein
VESSKVYSNISSLPPASAVFHTAVKPPVDFTPIQEITRVDVMTIMNWKISVHTTVLKPPIAV